MMPFDFGLRLRPERLRYQSAAQQERKAAEKVPYAAHYDCNTLLTRDSDLIQVIKLAGLAFETADERHLAQRKRFRNNLLRTIARSQYAVYQHTIRRKQHIYPDGRFSQGFARDLDQAWRSQHEQRQLYVNDLYLSLVRRPQMAGVAGIQGYLKKLAGKHQREQRDTALREAARELSEISQRFLTSLDEYRPQLLGITDGASGRVSEALRFVSFLINMQDRPVRVPQMDVARFLPYNRLIFGRDAFEVRSAVGNRVGAILSVKEYPSETDFGMLDAFLTIPVEMVITQSFVFIDRPKAKDLMAKQQDILLQVEDASESQIDEIDEALDDVTAGRTASGSHHMTVTVLADNLHELDKAVALATDAFVDIGVNPVREDLNMELCFWAQLPGNFRFITRGAPISSQNFAGFASLHNYACGNLSGNHWGPAVTVLETESKTPYYFSWHVGLAGSMPPGHSLIGAKTGTGKSLLDNFLLAQSLKFHPKIVYFDKDHGAEIFIRAIRGIHRTVSLSEPSGFNPLQLPDTGANRDFLNNWLRLLLTAHGEKLSAHEVDIVQHAVDENYRLDPSDRTLFHLAEHFGLKKAGSLGARLANWYGDGAYSSLFGGTQDLLRLDAAVYGFEMGRIIQDDVALAPVVAYLFHRIRMELDGKPVIIVLEEGSTLIRNPYFLSMIDNWLETVRKLNAMVIFVTPDLAATYRHGSDSLVKQTVTKILLANDEADRASYVERFNLSESEFEIVRELNPSEHVFLLKHGKDSVLARLDMSTLGRFIPVLSGTKTNVQIMRDLMQELGSEDPDVWLKPFMERVTL
jgi:type IV secretion system protein VirB4